jgi:hypothetical protein
MKGTELIAALKRKLALTTDTDLCKTLDLSAMTLNNWRHRKVTPRIVAQQICRGRLNGAEVVKALKRHLNTPTFTALAEKLGVTGQAIQDWKNRPYLTARQVAGLVKNSVSKNEKRQQATAMRPLVEFFPICKTASRQGAKVEVFSCKASRTSVHPYLSGLRTELEQHHGVYLFFDSRGQAIYAGKARKQSIWQEMHNAFNRDRDSVQSIKRVRHPSRKQKYRTTNEKARQITDTAVPLHDLATYFSAYHVTDGMIDDVEALLVRSFANNLLNIRMERFGRQRNGATTVPQRMKPRPKKSHIKRKS